ncbi:hypothetical protein ILUMI_19710, partial [Ignelater luminosus]
MPKKGRPLYDKLRKIQPLITKLSKKFEDAFDLSRYLSVDENVKLQLSGVLSTYFDIMKGYLWWRECMKAESNKDDSVLDVSQKLLIDTKNVWQKESLQAISDQWLIQK